MRTVFDTCRRICDALCDTMKPGRTFGEAALAARSAMGPIQGDVFQSGVFAYAVGAQFPPSWVEGTGYVADGVEREFERDMVFHLPICLRLPGACGIDCSDGAGHWGRRIASHPQPVVARHGGLSRHRRSAMKERPKITSTAYVDAKLETVLRVGFLLQWYALSDPMAEEVLHDRDAMRWFAGIELGDDRIPDEATILHFRHLLEKHRLTQKLFAEVNRHLADQGITLRSGTLVDATIIDAPSSTKNEDKARDPEMSSTKEGSDWCSA